MFDLLCLQWLSQRFCTHPHRRSNAVLWSGLLMLALPGCTLLDSQGHSSRPAPAPEIVAAAETTTPLLPNNASSNSTSTSTADTPSPQAENQAANQASSAVTADSQAENTVDQTDKADPYPDAIRKASLALTLTESAQSIDDWRLVAGRWQQAIDLLEAVPTSSEHYGNVASKLTIYRNKRDNANIQANQPVPTSSPLGSVVVVGDGEDENTTSAVTDTSVTDTAAEGEASTNAETVAAAPRGLDADNDASNDTPGANATEPAASQNTTPGTYEAPIIRRSGGTPVIHVRFNNRYTIEMIVDTGASGTVLTQQVAQTLGIQPIGETNMATASAQNVPFLLGRITSMEVNGASLENAVVAIAGPNLETGLLGNDFFRDYDVTVKSDVVEFRER